MKISLKAFFGGSNFSKYWFKKKKKSFSVLAFEASRQVGLTTIYFGHACPFLAYPSTLVSNDLGFALGYTVDA